MQSPQSRWVGAMFRYSCGLGDRVRSFAMPPLLLECGVPALNLLESQLSAETGMLVTLDGRRGEIRIHEEEMNPLST